MGEERTDLVCIFSSKGSIIRPTGSVLLKANDEWQFRRSCLGVPNFHLISEQGLARAVPSPSHEQRPPARL